MGRSLKSKISLLFTFSLFLMIFLCWMANNFFLPTYYEKTKVNSLEDVYDKIDEIVSQYGHESDDAVVAIEKVESVSNVSIYIHSDLNGNGLDFIYPLAFNIGSSEESIFRNDRLRRIIDALQRYIFGPAPGEPAPEQLKTRERLYDVFMCYEQRYDSKYIDLVGY